MEPLVTPSRSWRSMTTWWPWALGLVVSLLVVGPGLAPGSLLNLDLVLTPRQPLPEGVWGLGPELPRRVPMWVGVTWLSEVVGGDVIGKLMMVAGLTLAFVGMFRFTRSVLTRWSPSTADEVSFSILAVASATVYAFGPFLVTRVAIGHLMVLWVMAALPWSIEHLLDASASPARTLLWCTLFGVAGVYGGVVCGAIVVAGQIAQRGRRIGAVAGAYLVGQLLWLVPMAVVVLTAPPAAPSDAGSFPADISGLGTFGALAAGQGFWSPLFQVGRDVLYLPFVGLALLGLAIWGVAALPRPLRVPLTALAAISFVISASSALGGLDSVMVRFTATGLGAPFRETQRSLSLFIFWLAPVAALGAARIARSLDGVPRAVAYVVPLMAAMLLLGPGLGGAGGQLRPVTFSREWPAAQAIIDQEPGTALALPWYAYYSSAMTAHRTVLDVVPYYFGGDVIGASDPRVGSVTRRESLDPREGPANDIVDQLRAGRPMSAELRDLGVRWIIMRHAIDWETYTGLQDDPGLELALDGTELTILRVRDWAGPVVADDGTPVPQRGWVAPVQFLDEPRSGIRAAPFQSGWLQGGAAVTSTADGLMALPGGSTVLWYWPALVVMAADLVVLVFAVAAVLKLRRSSQFTQNDMNHARIDVIC